MNKITSGRFIFTIVTAIVFAWASYSKVLSDAHIAAIIMLVIGFYFHKSDKPKGA